MKKINLVFILAIACALFVCASGVASATTYYVPDDHEKIQWAVDNASAGDTIIVRDGTYNENVNVNKDYLTIKSENGAETTIVQAASSNDYVFEVVADHANINGFTMEEAATRHGIYLYGAYSCIISDNNMLNNYVGIYLYNSSDNDFINNNALNNGVGIWLVGSSDNDFINNSVNSGNGEGIYLYKSSSNTLTNNTVLNNNGDGICLSSSSSNNNLMNNNASNNYLHGIWMDHSSSNTLTNNTVLNNNADGIHLYYSSNNTITNNTANSNNGEGICMIFSRNNCIYLNNFIDNAGNVYSSYDNNIWNSTSPITYTYNGNTYTNYLGNYWSDYTGSDADGDGIGDTPYSIDSDADNYPLMESFENYIIGGGNQPPNPPTLISPGYDSPPGEVIYNLTPTFHWNEVPNADFYGLYISKYPYGPSNIVFDSELDYGPIYGSSFTLPSGILVDGEKYRWNMRAYNTNGWSDFSNRLFFGVKLPGCSIILEKNGEEIDEVKVGEFFDIRVEIVDDYDIVAIRFSSDDSQDGNPTGEWTQWYDWDISEGDWHADTKIKE